MHFKTKLQDKQLYYNISKHLNKHLPKNIYKWLKVGKICLIILTINVMKKSNHSIPSRYHTHTLYWMQLIGWITMSIARSGVWRKWKTDMLLVEMENVQLFLQGLRSFL